VENLSVMRAWARSDPVNSYSQVSHAKIALVEKVSPGPMLSLSIQVRLSFRFLKKVARYWFLCNRISSSRRCFGITGLRMIAIVGHFGATCRPPTTSTRDLAHPWFSAPADDCFVTKPRYPAHVCFPPCARAASLSVRKHGGPTWEKRSYRYHHSLHCS
jgi:hypothetical protein